MHNKARKGLKCLPGYHGTLSFKEAAELITKLQTKEDQKKQNTPHNNNTNNGIKGGRQADTTCAPELAAGPKMYGGIYAPLAVMKKQSYVYWLFINSKQQLFCAFL